MGQSLVCSISLLRKLGVERLKLKEEKAALVAIQKKKGDRKPDLLYFL